MKPGDVVFTRSIRVLIETSLFIGSTTYGVEDKKRDTLAFVYLGVSSKDEPLDPNARLKRFGWEYPEAQTEVEPEVMEARRRAVFGSPQEEQAR